MSVQGKRVVHVDGSPHHRTRSHISPKALYARPMALRLLYTDASSVIRRGQREAWEAEKAASAAPVRQETRAS